jgi:hypothetical protein
MLSRRRVWRAGAIEEFSGVLTKGAAFRMRAGA